MRYLSIEYNVNFASKGNVVIYIVSLPFFFILLFYFIVFRKDNCIYMFSRLVEHYLMYFYLELTLLLL